MNIVKTIIQNIEWEIYKRKKRKKLEIKELLLQIAWELLFIPT